MNKTITLLIIGVIFLALLLMMLNSFMVEERHGVPEALNEKTRPQEQAPPARGPEERAASVPLPALPVPEAQGGVVLAPPALQATPQTPESIAVAQGPSAAGVTAKTVPAQIDAGHMAPAPLAPQTIAPPAPASPTLPVAPQANAKQTSGGAKNITNIIVYATQEGATLRLGGDSPFVYKSLLLRDPDRFVLDFEGQWNVNIPGIPQNKIVKAIRVGQQADSTRMVIDLHRAPVSYRLIKASPQRLDVRLR